VQHLLTINPYFQAELPIPFTILQSCFEQVQQQFTPEPPGWIRQRLAEWQLTRGQHLPAFLAFAHSHRHWVQRLITW